MKPLQIVMVGASLDQNGGIATVEKLIINHAPAEVEIHHLTSHVVGSMVERLVVFTRCLLGLYHRLIFYPVDTVYIHLSDGGSLLRKSIIAAIAFSFGKSVVVHTHGGKFPETYHRLPKFGQKLVSSSFRRCDAFIVLSKSWQDFYVVNCHLNPQRVFVLTNPTEIPAEIPDRNHRDGEVTLFYCGRISEKKGAFDLITAFGRLPEQQQKRSKLVMAGDMGVEEGQKLVIRLNLTDRVTFPGWVDSKTREQLLAESDIFILPSYHEGLPMGILEAMSWGLPVISTPVGGIPEILHDRHNGLLIPPGDLEQLSLAMQSLIEDRNLRLSLGKEARVSVQPFDIKNYWHELSDVFDRALI
jgi:glycosyltransferase involved in cell wall biosynthesis